MSTKVSTKNSVDKETLLKIDQQLQKYYNISIADATDKQIFNALAHIAIDKAFEKRRKFSKSCKKSDAKALTTYVWSF